MMDLFTVDESVLRATARTMEQRHGAQAAAVLAEAADAGGQILKPAADRFWGGYSGYFADPDGHAWEVACNPAWTIADDGSVSLARRSSA